MSSSPELLNDQPTKPADASVKIPRFLGAKNFFDVVVAAVFGILGVLGNMVFSPLNDKLLQLAWSLTLITAVTVGALLYVNRSTRLLQKDLCEERERSKSLQAAVQQSQRDCATLKGKFEFISEQFRSLSRASHAFETQLAVFNNTVIHGLVDAAREAAQRNDAAPTVRYLKLRQSQLDKVIAVLDKKYYELLDHICNTAVIVIDTCKEHRYRSSASLTLITLTEKNEATYWPMTRSSGAPASRAADDDRRRREPHLAVAKNYMLDQLVKMNPDASECHYIVTDMDAEMQLVERQRSHYVEPRKDATDLYQSCLIVPITELGNDGMVATRESSPPGFLCIDNLQKSAFDAKYDLQVMKKLAHHAASAIATHMAAKTVFEKVSNLTQ